LETSIYVLITLKTLIKNLKQPNIYDNKKDIGIKTNYTPLLVVCALFLGKNIISLMPD